MISENVAQIIAVELLGAIQALQFRFQNEPGFTIPHPGLKLIYEHAKNISPILSNDRYTVPEFQELLQFITSGDLWDMMLENMQSKYFNIEVPHEYKKPINTYPF